MDVTTPILLVASASLVAIAVTPLVSRMIAGAAAELSDQFSEDSDDLSRIRPR